MTLSSPAAAPLYDAQFSGTVAGTRLNGSVVGVDGARLAFLGTGIAIATGGAGPLPLFEQGTLHSTDARYLWVNGLPIWGRGTIDLSRAQLRVRGFTDPDVLAAALQRAPVPAP